MSNFLKRVVRSGLVITSFLVLSVQIVQADSGTYSKGQHIEPAFEGWHPNADGSFSLMFGYMNENWKEEPNVPVGENNFFSPGDPDRGQPTHFLPRRNRFTFEVVVPADWGKKEMVWNLSVRGVERKAYGTLNPDYLVDNMVIASETGSLGAGTSSPESRANIPPVVTVQGDTVAGEHIRNIQVGEILTLTALVEDDGLPEPTDIVEQARAFAEFAGAGAAAIFLTSEIVLKQRMMNPPIKVTVNKMNGLFLSWNVYRGEGSVTFEPPQVKPWEDTRTSANSPWGALWLPPEIPADGLHEVRVTFDQPGTYVLWARADDGGLFHDQYVTVNVSP